MQNYEIMAASESINGKYMYTKTIYFTVAYIITDIITDINQLPIPPTNNYQLLVDILRELTEDSTLYLPSSNAQYSLKSIKAMLSWCQTQHNFMEADKFATSLLSALKAWVGSEPSKKLPSEKMMGIYHQLS